MAKSFVELFKISVNRWFEHEPARMGAALSYYTVFSLAPLLVIIIAIAGLIFGREASQGQIVSQISGLVGTEGAKFIETMLESAYKPATGVMAALMGLLTLLFGATGVMVELRDDLNDIWEVKAKPGAAFLGLVRARFSALGMILGIGFLLLVSLAISAWLAAAGKFFGGLMPIPEAVLHAITLVFSFAFITALFALIFKYLPDIRLEWRDVIFGAAVTSLLFSIGKFLIGLYLGKSSIGSAYGAAGSLAVLLVWIYYSAQIVLLGAQFTKVKAEVRSREQVVRSQESEFRSRHPTTLRAPG